MEEIRDSDRAVIVPVLPHVFGTGAKVPDDIRSAELIQMGTVAGASSLVIDYLPAGDRRIRRMVLRFGDRGMWISESGFLPTQDSSSRCDPSQPE